MQKRGSAMLQFMQGKEQLARMTDPLNMSTSELKLRHIVELQISHNPGQGWQVPFSRKSPIWQPVHSETLAMLQFMHPLGTVQGIHMPEVVLRACSREQLLHIPVVLLTFWQARAGEQVVMVMLFIVVVLRRKF